VTGILDKDDYLMDNATLSFIKIKNMFEDLIIKNAKLPHLVDRKIQIPILKTNENGKWQWNPSMHDKSCKKSCGPNHLFEWIWESSGKLKVIYD